MIASIIADITNPQLPLLQTYKIYFVNCIIRFIIVLNNYLKTCIILFTFNECKHLLDANRYHLIVTNKKDSIAVKIIYLCMRLETAVARMLPARRLAVCVCVYGKVRKKTLNIFNFIFLYLISGFLGTIDFFSNFLFSVQAKG